MSVDKGRIKAKEIDDVGDAAEPGWTVPTLRLDGTELRLTAKIFYWGVRRTVINVVAARRSAKIPVHPTSIILSPTAVRYGATGPTKVDSGSTD